MERFNEQLPSAGTLVVVPTYNERENIANMLAALSRLDPPVDILVVDDASPDGTAEAVRAAAPGLSRRAVLLTRPGKAGLGTAYRDGFAWALEHLREPDVLVEMDADFSHDPNDVNALAAQARTHGASIGSRYVPGGAMPDWKFTRRFVSRVANAYVRTVLGRFDRSYAVRDSTAGFVAWRRDVLRRVLDARVPGTGYGFQISMKYVAHRLGAACSEHPITFRDRRLGQSKLPKSFVLEALGIVWVLGWRFRKQPRSGS